MFRRIVQTTDNIALLGDLGREPGLVPLPKSDRVRRKSRFLRGELRHGLMITSICAPGVHSYGCVIFRSWVAEYLFLSRIGVLIYSVVSQVRRNNG